MRTIRLKAMPPPVLRHLFAAKMHLRAGHHDEAMALAFALGELVTEAGMKEIFEQDVDSANAFAQAAAERMSRRTEPRTRYRLVTRRMPPRSKDLWRKDVAGWTPTGPRRRRTGSAKRPYGEPSRD